MLYNRSREEGPPSGKAKLEMQRLSERNADRACGHETAPAAACCALSESSCASWVSTSPSGSPWGQGALVTPQQFSKAGSWALGAEARPTTLPKAPPGAPRAHTPASTRHRWGACCLPRLLVPSKPLGAVSYQERLGASTHLCPSHSVTLRPLPSRDKCHTAMSLTAVTWPQPLPRLFPRQVLRANRNCQGTRALWRVPSPHHHPSPSCRPRAPAQAGWHMSWAEQAPPFSGRRRLGVQARNTPHSSGLPPESSRQ